MKELKKARGNGGVKPVETMGDIGVLVLVDDD